MNRPARVAVFASGGGSNLQSLMDRLHASPRPLARVELVLGSREGIGALDRAAAAGVATAVLDPRRVPAAEAAGTMLELLEEHRIDLVVLAGYLHLVPRAVVARYHGRMLNVHPALLPAFGGPGLYGARVHRAVLESGARISGATVHLVDERYDSGPIVAQWPVPVLDGDTPESLAARVLAVEHRLLPAVVEVFASQGRQRGELRDPVCFALLGQPAPAPDAILALVRSPVPAAEAGEG